MSEQNLNDIMAYSMAHPSQSQFKLYSQLKFKNTLYRTGDDIMLYSQREAYAKIISIAQIKSIQFPVLYVSWYLTLQDPVVAEQGFTHLDKRELIFSQYADWQYVQALKGKISIVSQQEYALLDIRQRQISKKMFCRSSMVPNSYNFLDRMPKRVCTCMRYFNPGQKLNSCVICGLRFHASCSGYPDVCSVCVS